MWTRVFICLLGAVFMYEVISSDIYISELMVESNVTLEAQDILSSWDTSFNLQVTGSGQSHTVTLLDRELVAECLIVGEDYSCNCSTRYHWSNEVCYTYNCCRETTCTKNVSFITPICVEKDKVVINGSVEVPSWTQIQTNELTQGFELLNALKYLNITVMRTPGKTIADFEALVSVKLNTSKLQEIMDGLKSSLQTDLIFVDTQGMVTINAPFGTVNYTSTHHLKCTFEEATDRAGWNLSRKFERFELNNGRLVTLDFNCHTEEYKSCVAVRLVNVTGIWSGTYECGFTTGSVRHTARTLMHVASLPDTISISINPLTADCTANDPPAVLVTAIIPNVTEGYNYWWSYNGIDTVEASTENIDIFNYKATIDCKKKDKPHYVHITFKNNKDQEKTASVEIPVLYAGEAFCKEEIDNGETWPKAPVESTVINRSCPDGRVGYKSRTCSKSGVWMDVYPNCVSEELIKVSQAADNFLNGLGATNKVAKDIFGGIKNSSKSNSESDGDMADKIASINVVDTMARASNNIALQEEVFPEFVEAASNMLNSNWTGVNNTVRYKMSSKYLKSVEDLVKNINVNTSSGFNSTNLDLRFCSSNNCNASVFDIDVNLNMTNGTMKVMAVKNLMNKLRNNFPKTYHTSLLLSATLVNNNDSNTGIRLSFPSESPSSTKHVCVFWDTKKNDWSDEGCVVNTTDGNHTVCECNHLTSFSVLMSKSDISSDSLDMITKVGLGVSVCSLLIFLFIEFLVWSAVIKTNLSHFRHTAVVNIAVFRLLADCSFLASFSPDKLSDTLCLTFTVCKHLFYLAMFTWMLCLSVMLVHQLIFVFSPLRKRVFMFLSSILGYVCPILLVGSSYVYYKYTKKDYYDKKTCWLNYERLLVGSIHAFLLPVGTIVLANLFSMVVVILTLVKTSVPDSSKADEKETAKSILKVVVFLTPVFGVTWTIGFFLLVLDESNSMYTAINYIFTILNSFQGLFILLTGCFAEQKVREELFKIIKAKSGRNNNSVKKLTSSATATTYTKDK